MKCEDWTGVSKGENYEDEMAQLWYKESCLFFSADDHFKKANTLIQECKEAGWFKDHWKHFLRDDLYNAQDYGILWDTSMIDIKHLTDNYPFPSLYKFYWTGKGFFTNNQPTILLSFDFSISSVDQLELLLPFIKNKSIDETLLFHKDQRVRSFYKTLLEFAEHSQYLLGEK